MSLNLFCKPKRWYVPVLQFMVGFSNALPSIAWQEYQGKGPHLLSPANLGFVTDDFRGDGSAGGEHQRTCLQCPSDDRGSLSFQYNHFALDFQVSGVFPSEEQAKTYSEHIVELVA